MEMKEERKVLRPWHGIIVFVVGVVLLATAGGLVQYYWGMLGLVITELMILLVGMVPALLWKQDLKEVFPLRRPRLRELFGTILLWGGSYLLVMIVTMVIACFFPEEVLGTSSAMMQMFQSVPFIISFFIVAVMPAVCEEAMNRGFIQYTLKGIKSDAAVVIIMGFLFGVFHLDPVRFLPTAILGGSLAYLLRKTGNILWPMVFHFINNALSVLSSYFSGEAATALELTSEAAFLSLGSCLIIGVLMPPCLLGASYLLKGNEELKAIPMKKIITGIVIAVILMVAMFITGAGIIGYSVANTSLLQDLL